MIEKINKIIDNYNTISSEMSDPNIISNPHLYARKAKEHKSLENIVSKGSEYLACLDEMNEMNDILEGDDKELIEIVNNDIQDLKSKISTLEDKLKILLIPKDPDDSKDTIIEIRCGTGGDEAALFAGDLYRMYDRFAEKKKWKREVISINENEGGGLKEIIISFKGNDAFGTLKYESGVHRVQRVPETESSGRIHTSAATVAVLPEADNIDIEINEADLKIDTYRASGAGGQHVNKTESAIRITHIPSGLIVTCQDESSQHKNKDKAMKVLRSKLYTMETEKQRKERDEVRKSMVSTGDRSAKIRTYNFPQGRVTDHRINLTLYKLNEILDGDILLVVDHLKLEDQKSLLSQ